MKLNIPLPLPSDGNPIQSSPVITTELEDGRHTAETRPVTFGDGSMQARLVIQYEYSREANWVKLCSGSYIGRDATRMIITKGDSAVCEVSPHPGYSRLYDANPSFTSGVAAMEQSLRDAVDGMIAKAQESQTEVLIRTNMVSLPQDEMKDLAIIYSNGLYQGIYDPDASYPSDVQIMPIMSVYGGIKQVARNEAFYNVNGSTGDKGNWSDFWIANTTNYLARLVPPRPPIAVSCNARGSMKSNGNASCTPATAARQFLGGHVVNNQADINPDHGVNGVVFIIPICYAHNNTSNQMVMASPAATLGVWLNHYHQ